MSAISCAIAFGDDPTHLENLLSCYQRLRPFTMTGAHATVYPNSQNIVFIPGKHADKDGVYVYTDQGASFINVADAYAKKAIAFDITSTKGTQAVVYQPGDEGRRAQVWIRGTPNTVNSGVTIAFKNAEDADKRAPLEVELELMVKGMARTWDIREDQLVQAVEQGKYLWVEVDLDHYKDAANHCLKISGDSNETAALRTSIHSELDALNRRATRSGMVHDEMVAPSTFMSTPQY